MKAYPLALASILTTLLAACAHAEPRVTGGFSSAVAPASGRLPPSHFSPTVRASVWPAAVPLHRSDEGPRYETASGYWQEVAVRVWVPARWALRRNHSGHTIQVFEPAHFVVRPNRVWVDRCGEGDRGSPSPGW